MNSILFLFGVVILCGCATAPSGLSQGQIGAYAGANAGVTLPLPAGRTLDTAPTSARPTLEIRASTRERAIDK